MRPFAIALLSLAHLWPAGGAPVVDASNFSGLHRLMQPTPDESRWQSIPWRTNLWQARIDAAAAGKPIYLWEMDGHPLGCT